MVDLKCSIRRVYDLLASVLPVANAFELADWLHTLLPLHHQLCSAPPAGAMDGWNAMHEWPSLQWWNHNHGHRTIPVELGTDSTNSWRETTMLLQTFMSDDMQPSVSRQPDADMAYIAQHPLFDQLPSLMSDFEQPELMGGEAMQMNAWIGTEGTVTPLHFDSYDNFLAQVC